MRKLEPVRSYKGLVFSEEHSSSALIAEASFVKMLQVEQKRTERSRRPFLLMLLEVTGSSASKARLVDELRTILTRATRATDIKGWFQDNEVIGVIFTEIAKQEEQIAAEALLRKVHRELAKVLTSEQLAQIRISSHLFPEDWYDQDGDHSDGERAAAVLKDSEPRKLAHAVKRSMDVAGSLLMLILFAPLMIPIALAIKLSSKGPILFRQQRVGQHGRPFTFFKFRSMQARSDHSVHEEFVKKLIQGYDEAQKSTGDGKPIYKMTDDRRVTAVGRLLRRTSLDELPQIFNVLAGQMSLVGPRPPMPYEVACYDVWHKRRLLVARPGLTGLWQVQGRSRVKFDDMVRLDLKYAESWSVWLDIKILLQTPRAMVSGNGAF